jgi:hypothetical protein
MSMVTPDQALYVFCLGRSQPVSVLDGHATEQGQPLRVVPAGEIAAVATTVSRDEFCGPEADSRLADLAWVGQRACLHEATVEQAMARSPVVPLPFGTLFSSPERLIAWLDRHNADVLSALDRFDDHEEWAVSGHMDRPAVEARLFQQETASRGPAPTPGRQYLQERQIRAGIGTRVDDWLATLLPQVASFLSMRAADFVEREAAGGVTEPEQCRVANWAFLVPHDGVDTFRQAVEAINGECARLDLAFACSGPWPPYTFSPALRAEGPA